MTTGLKTVMYPVSDLEKSKRLFAALFDTDPYMGEPYYVGYHMAGQDVGLDPNGHQMGLTGPTGYWHVPDIAAAVDALVANGATKTQDVTDVGGGKLIATITDVGGGKLIATITDGDGNPIGLLQVP